MNVVDDIHCSCEMELKNYLLQEKLTVNKNFTNIKIDLNTE